MKTAILALAAALALAVAASPAAATTPRTPLLRGNQCLDPDYARGWVYLDDTNMLVDTGRIRYHIELNARCHDIAWAPVIAFRGDPITGYVCGNAFDAVITRERPCTIRNMSLISKEQYKALEQEYHDRRRDRHRLVPRSYE
jgi:hypothetical protein